MNEHIEIEYKILLTKDIFLQILKQYQSQIQNDYIQINHYLTHPLLQQKKYMLRIREKNNTFELTLKRPTNNHRLETNIMITAQERDKIFQHIPISNEIIDILTKENINPLELQNQFSLTTHRYDIILPEGTLSLDDNVYLDQHDYELEFEVNDEKSGYQKFLHIIQPFHLLYVKNCPSKIQRAFYAFNQKNI